MNTVRQMLLGWLLLQEGIITRRDLGELYLELTETTQLLQLVCERISWLLDDLWWVVRNLDCILLGCILILLASLFAEEVEEEVQVVTILRGKEHSVHVAFGILILKVSVPAHVHCTLRAGDRIRIRHWLHLGFLKHERRTSFVSAPTVFDTKPIVTEAQEVLA